MASNNYIYKMSNAGGMSNVTRYTDMLAGNPAFIDAAYDSIATVTVGAGGSATVTFSSIPSTYQHLQVRYIGRNSGGAQGHTLNFNSDTGSNYAFHSLQGTGTAATATYNGVSQTTAPSGYLAPSTSGSNIFGVGVVDILDYQNTNKYKTVRTLSGEDENGAGLVGIYSNLWMSTSAITSITFTAQSGGSYTQYSSFALYGIKG
jgi:hypothetical protein